MDDGAVVSVEVVGFRRIECIDACRCEIQPDQDSLAIGEGRTYV